MSNLLCNFLPIFIGLGSALLGGLIGWYIHRQRSQELEEELEELQSNNARLIHAHDTLNIRCENLQNSFASLNDTHKKLETAHLDLHNSHSLLSIEKENVDSALAKKIAMLSLPLFAPTPEVVEEVVPVAPTIEPVTAFLAEPIDFVEPVDNEAFTTQITHLTEQLASVNAEYFDYKTTTTQRLEEGEAQLTDLQKQYDTMLDNYIQQGQRLKTLTAEMEEWQGNYNGLMLKNNNQDTHVIELEELRSSLETEVHLLRGRFNELQGRNTILEHEWTTLNQNYTALEVEKAHIHNSFADANAVFQTKSTNWEAQYAELEARHSSLTRRFQDLNVANETMEKSVSTLNLELLAFRSRANPDDLKIIEGIGPKIEELLNNDGIYKYAQLAATPVDTVRGILEKAGSRFRMHDPQTWGIQADIADKADWVKLKEYQDYLVAGRNPEQTLAAAG